MRKRAVTTSVLCTSDSVPSSFILKISRNGSDLLKKSFKGKKTHTRVKDSLRSAFDHQINQTLSESSVRLFFFLPLSFFLFSSTHPSPVLSKLTTPPSL